MGQGLLRAQPAATATFAFGPLALDVRHLHPKNDHPVDLSQLPIFVCPHRPKIDLADQPRFFPCLLSSCLAKPEAVLQPPLGHQPVFAAAGGDQADSAIAHGNDRRLLNCLPAILDITNHTTSPCLETSFKPAM